MHTFKEFFAFEWVRFLGKRNLVVFGLLFVLVLGLTQYGVVHYKNILKEKEKFREFEKERFKAVFSYKFYGTYGFRLTAVPAPFFIFVAKSSPFNDMSTLIDTSERLAVEDSLQAGNAFKARRSYFNDFSSGMAIFGMFLALLFGMETFLTVDYTKILVSIAGHKKVFLNLILSRAALLCLLFAIMFVSAYLLVLVNGIYMPIEWVLPFFLLLICAMAVFFFSLGVLMGTHRSKVAGLLIGLFLWFCLIWIAPSVVASIVELSSNSLISVNELNLEKFRKFTDFQEKYRLEEGELKPGELPSKSGEEKIVKFWKNEFKCMLDKDANLIRKMEKQAVLFQWLSSIFPTSNFVSAIYELSSNGFEGLIDFNWLTYKIKISFYERFIEVVYILKKPYEKVEPYLKDGENLFPLKTKISLPALIGILLTLIYTVALLTFSHKRYKKELFRLPEKDENHSDGLAHKLGKGGVFPFFIEKDIFGRQLFNLFSGQREEIGKSGYDFKITFEPEDLVPGDKKSDFLYLPHINKIPDHFKAGAFVKLLMGLARTGKERREEIVSKYDLKPLWRKAFRDLNAVEKGRVFMAMLYVRTFEIYLIDDALDGMSYRFAKELKDGLTELAEKEKAAAIFTINYGYVEKGKKQPPLSYTLFVPWMQQLDLQAEVEAKNDRDRS